MSHSGLWIEVNRIEWQLREVCRGIIEYPTRWLYRACRRLIEPLRATLRANFEYYRDDEGKIRLRRSTGRSGVYSYIDGKLVKTRDFSTDKFDLIPWKETNAGYYDEELGTHIESKDHYRREMKAAGLVPRERNRYGKSQARIREDIVDRQMAKYKPTIEKAFVEACRREGL